jgi:hypothetical protein
MRAENEKQNVHDVNVLPRSLREMDVAICASVLRIWERQREGGGAPLGSARRNANPARRRDTLHDAQHDTGERGIDGREAAQRFASGIEIASGRRSA